MVELLSLKRKIIFFWFTSYLLINCASYKEQTQKIRDNYNSYQFSKALEELEASELKNDKKSKLLYYLEKAMILDRIGQKEGARKALLHAEQISKKLYTVSILNTAQSFIFNDSSQDYSGENYEQIAINTMLALSFIETKELSKARVEAKKINIKLHSISNQMGDKNNSYKEDGLARYLSGVIYESKNQYDDAIVDYRAALKVYSQGSYRKFYRGNIPEQIIKALYRLSYKRNRKSIIKELNESYPLISKEVLNSLESKKKTGQIIVFHEVGTIEPKREKSFFINLRNEVIRFSFPYIQKNSWSGGVSGLTVNEEAMINAENFVDMTSLAHYCLEERRLRLITKSMARLLLKSSVKEKLGPWGGLAMNIYSIATETADTRGWNLLPGHILISRKNVPIGKHTLRITSGGRISEVKTVTIEEDQIYIYRSIDKRSSIVDHPST